MSAPARDIMSDLATYMAAAAAKRFAWGAARPNTQDCCTLGWDWVRLRTGIDAMADVRGCYRDLDAALDILRANGCATLADAVRLGAARLGLEVVDVPGLGDIGLVAAPNPMTGDTLCIRMYNAWAAPALRGIAETRAQASICWRVP